MDEHRVGADDDNARWLVGPAFEGLQYVQTRDGGQRRIEQDDLGYVLACQEQCLVAITRLPHGPAFELQQRGHLPGVGVVFDYQRRRASASATDSVPGGASSTLVRVTIMAVAFSAV